MGRVCNTRLVCLSLMFKFIIVLFRSCPVPGRGGVVTGASLSSSSSSTSTSKIVQLSQKSATSGGGFMKYTDPALNARAATAKDQLLQWCQMKTKEYEVPAV